MVIPANFDDLDAVTELARRAVEFLGGVDCLVNNSGITLNKPFLEVTREQFDLLYGVNIRAQFFLTQQIVRDMLPRGGGAGEPFRIGDQAAVVPSFCGDGVAMALGSGLAAAGALGRGVKASAHHAAWASGIASGMRLAGMLSWLAAHAPHLVLVGAALAPGAARWAARRTRLGHAEIDPDGLDPRA